MSFEAKSHLLSELQTRFLYPFYFERNAVQRASTLLQELALAGGHGTWKQGEPHDLYCEEMLPHVGRFLFPEEGRITRCNYLEVENGLLNRIFHDGLVFELAGADKITKKLIVQRSGIEVFLNEHGVGLLSLNLKLKSNNLSLADSLSFNHLLIQPRQKFPAGLRLPDALNEPEQFAKMPKEHREKMPPPDNAPLTERLGTRGGRFWLSELAYALMQPLLPLGFQPVIQSDLIQAQFWIYSTAVFDESVDWKDDATRRQLAPFLAGLAQAEEPGHACAVEDELGVPNIIQNTKHWAAVSLMGAVHLLADQPNNHQFNPSRSGRAMRKYFVPFLVSLFQRLVLQRAMGDASVLVKSANAAARLSSLRQALLEFGVGGHFEQVSSRHAVQRFYAIAEEGFGINAGWQNVRQAIADLDAKFAAEQMLKLADETKVLAEGQTRASEGLLRLQATVHWIEAFIVSVYAAELWHLFASDVPSLHEFVPAGVVLFALTGLAGALIVLKPWKHK